jgi:lia operon protein LiaF
MKNEEKILKEESTPLYDYDLRRKKHGNGILGGLVLIFLGTVFLLNNLGILPSNVWNEVWKFWPVLFILFGLRLLGGKNIVSRIIITLVTLFAFAGVLAYILFYYGVLRIFGL